MMAEIKFDYEYSLKSKLFELRNKNKITEREYRELIKIYIHLNQFHIK